MISERNAILQAKDYMALSGEKAVRVLLVEDDVEDAQLARELLGGIAIARYEVTLATSVAEALSCLDRHEHDVCLLDYYLGDGTGTELLREVARRGCHVPIVFLTGHGNYEIERVAMEAGAMDYLEKGSLSSNLLERSIRYAIARQKGIEALRRAHDELEQRVSERTNELSLAFEALRVSEARLSEAERIGHLGGWDWDLAAGELACSGEAQRILGAASGLVTAGRLAFLDGVHRDDQERVEECLKQSLQHEETFELECRVPDANDGVRHVRILGEVRRDAQGKPVRTVGTVQDITEQFQVQEESKLRQRQLLQADKMASLGILASGIAHEINNPNHSIMLNASVLRRLWKDVEPILEKFHGEFGDFVLDGFEYAELRGRTAEIFDGLEQNSERIKRIVAELRDFSREHPENHMAQINLGVVLESAQVLVANLLKSSTDRFELCLDGALPPVRGDFQRLEQVVINLIQNACQALPDRDKVIVLSTGSDAEGGTVFFEVRDEGTGIAPDDLKHITDPFFTTKGTLGGTGLGLWICANIVREHGGTLTIDSEVGRGTIARVVLPAIKADNV